MSYEIQDHILDVAVLGAGGSGLRASLGCAEKGLKTACISKVSNQKPYSCSPRWCWCSFRKYGKRRLEMAYVRHS